MRIDYGHSSSSFLFCMHKIKKKFVFVHVLISFHLENNNMEFHLNEWLLWINLCTSFYIDICICVCPQMHTQKFSFCFSFYFLLSWSGALKQSIFFLFRYCHYCYAYHFFFAIFNRHTFYENIQSTMFQHECKVYTQHLNTYSILKCVHTL